MNKRIVTTLLSLLILVTYSIPHVIVRVKSGNLYKGWFTEPIEIFYVVFWNGLKIKVTNYETQSVSVDIDALVKATGFKYSDIMFVIHNHWFYPYPSETDIKTFHRMRRMGFRGWFLIYRQSTQEIIELGVKENTE